MQSIQNLINQLKGWKTYIVATSTVIYAAAGYLSGNMNLTQMLGFLLFGAGAATLRAAIAKVEQYLPYLFDAAIMIQDLSEKVKTLQGVVNSTETAKPAVPGQPGTQAGI